MSDFEKEKNEVEEWEYINNVKMSKKHCFEFKNIKVHVDMCATERMREHAGSDRNDHPLDFQVFRFLTGYDEELEEIARLRAEIELMNAALKDIAKQHKSDEWEEKGDTEYGYDMIIDIARKTLQNKEIDNA